MSRPPSRAEQALATRRRVVRAAYDLFCRDGYLGTTMQAIAKEGDVAVQTLYYTFHTKAALLGEALGAAIVGFDRWREPPATPTTAELLTALDWWEEFESAPTAHAALAIWVKHGLDILERVGPLTGALRGAAGDDDADVVVRLSEERRVESYRAGVRVIAGKPDGLRDGLSVAAATDITVVLFSAEVWHGLAHGRGWSAARRRAFFNDVLRSQLLDAPLAQ